MIKCGITGSSGILGKEIIKHLPYSFNKFNGDITSVSDIQKWLINNDFDIIIHLCSIVPISEVNKDYLYAKKVNYRGTKNLIDLIFKMNLKTKWFFFSSSSHVYKKTNNYKKINENFKKVPISKYGNTKYLAEKYIVKKFKKKRINYCIGRIFSFTHKNQKKSFVIPGINEKIKKNKKINLTNINHYRDFVSTKDICKAVEALRIANARGIYNIGSGKKTSITKVANFFSKHYNKEIIIKNNNNPTYLIANIDKIKKIGWKANDKIEDILKSFF